MKINKFSMSIISCLMLIGSTVDARYKSESLKKSVRNSSDLMKEYIAFDYKIFNSKDCKTYFNCKGLIKKGYQPVQITFTNNSKSSISISADSSGLPQNNLTIS